MHYGAEQWLAAGMTLGLAGLSAWAGYEWCQFTHKSKGYEVDRDVHPWDLLPMPPSPIVVPDDARELTMFDEEAYQ